MVATYMIPDTLSRGHPPSALAPCATAAATQASALGCLSGQRDGGQPPQWPGRPAAPILPPRWRSGALAPPQATRGSQRDPFPVTFVTGYFAPPEGQLGAGAVDWLLPNAWFISR